jgi:hypothetical protein
VSHGHHKTSEEPLRLVHHHPGYVRAQANAFLGAEADRSTVKEARTTAEGIRGFRSWSHNPRTGSFVIEYELGRLDPDHLLGQIAKKTRLNGVVMDVDSTVHRQELLKGFLDAVQEVNGIVGRVTGEKADLRELVPLSLAAVSVVSFVLGERGGVRMPRWDSALYRGYRIFMQWHRNEVRERERVAAKLEEKTEEARHAHGDAG